MHTQSQTGTASAPLLMARGFNMALLITTTLLATAQAQAMGKLAEWVDGEPGYSGTVDNLAQGCYALQSAHTGKFLQRYKAGGLIDDGLSYHFSAADKHHAAAFFIKPTALEHFLLRDADGRYLASYLPLNISAGKSAGNFANWKIAALEGQDSAYTLTAAALKQPLRHNIENGATSLSELGNAGNAYRFVKSEGCTPFPEVTTNATGDFSKLKGAVDQPVRGFIDPHVHITSFQFMGGRMMAGEPFSPWGVEFALQDSKNLHGEQGALDIIGNLYTFNDLKKRYDTRGWPDFPWWPNYQQMSHMGYYYKWIERAHAAGLRIMVSNLVENKVLCNLQSTINPASWIFPNSCNTMDSVHLQIKTLRKMQDYIDAQSGGAGKGFFRLVNTPQEARQVIADGKMAVVMGIEASETFNCGAGSKTCTKESVAEQLDELYKLGVRSIFPTHKFDNRFGGSAVEGGFINVGNFISSGGKFFKTEKCDAQTKGVKIETGFPLIGKLPVIKEFLDAIKLNPVYDETIEHCNQKGITELGVFLVNKLIDKGMMIELDHTSNKTASAILDIAEQRNYSGLITSHSWMRAGSDGKAHYNIKRLIKAGGFTAPYNESAHIMARRIDRYLTEIEKTNFVRGVGIGTDMAGLGTQAAPRKDAASDPLQYPFTNEFGITFERQKSGNRVFDLNKDGIAHYGMVADQIQDMRVRTGERVYEAVMNSAEAYLQMWERSASAAIE